jgi:hypothetical protein
VSFVPLRVHRRHFRHERHNVSFVSFVLRCAFLGQPFFEERKNSTHALGARSNGAELGDGRRRQLTGHGRDASRPLRRPELTRNC